MKIDFLELIQQIEDFLMVETKDSRVIPFILNGIQRSFVNKIDFYKKKYSDRPLRVIILKGRQFGFSTLILAYFFVKCLLCENTRAVVISHEGEATKKLFRRVRFFASTMMLKPVLDKESEREYSFPRTNSYFYIGTAGSRAFGRGDNLTDVHASEVAFWENAAETMNGLIQAVGLTGNIYIETTANGVGNYFYKLWKKSYKNPDSAWLALFFKWTNFNEYEIEPQQDFRRTPEEEQLCLEHPELTNRKLQWRRWKISEIETEPGLEAEDVFRQEYPLTPNEAFISSGRNVFNLKSLELQEPKQYNKILSDFKIWQEPNGVMSYMGIDVAEGLENKDRSVIVIFNSDLEQAAEWAGWCDTDELADLAVLMAERYNSYMICECNAVGIAVQNILRKKYPLSKQYHREVFDEISKTKIMKVGWKTTTTTKPKMIANLESVIRKKEIILNNFDTINEFMSYVKNGKGGYEAEEGANDDRVIATGLALQGWLDRPPKHTTLQQREQLNIQQLNRKWHARRKKEAKLKYARQKNRKFI